MCPAYESPLLISSSTNVVLSTSKQASNQLVRRHIASEPENGFKDCVRDNQNANTTYKFLYPIFVVLIQDLGCHREHSLDVLPRLRRSLDKEGYIVTFLKIARFLN